MSNDNRNELQGRRNIAAQQAADLEEQSVGDNRNELAELSTLLAYHVRLDAPGGKCLCGRETGLGGMFTWHIAELILAAGYHTTPNNGDDLEWHRAALSRETARADGYLAIIEELRVSRALPHQAELGRCVECGGNGYHDLTCPAALAAVLPYPENREHTP